MSVEPVSMRINDPEVKRRLAAYKERNRIRKLQKEYDEVFKDVEPHVGDTFWETDIDELPSLVGNPNVSYSPEVAAARSGRTLDQIQNEAAERLGIGNNDRSPEHNSIVRQMISNQNQRNRVPTLDQAINHLHNNIGSNLGMTRSRTGVDRMEAYNASKEPFYHKIWFKVGLPSGITFIASLTELWRAFH